MVVGFFTSFRMTGNESEIDDDVAEESREEDHRPMLTEHNGKRYGYQSDCQENNPLDVLNPGGFPRSEFHREHRHLADQQ